MPSLSDQAIADQRACLNHADLNELWANRHDLLTPFEVELLSVVRRKIELHPDWFAREGQWYAQTAGLILMAEEYAAKLNFCTCMDRVARKRFRIQKHEQQPCNCAMWRHCDHCDWRRQIDLQCRFLRQYREGCCFKLTISFTGNLSITGEVGQHHRLLTHCDLDTYWDAARHAVRFLVDEGVISGAVLQDELHLEQLFPSVLVLPHMHMVFWAKKLPDNFAERIKELMLEHRGEVWNLHNDSIETPRWQRHFERLRRWRKEMKTAKKNSPNDLQRKNSKKTSKPKPRMPPLLMVSDPAMKVELPISIDGPTLLPTRHDFAQRLSYQMKPTKLAEVYEQMRPLVLEQHGQAGLIWLNDNVTEFIHGLDEWLLPRRQPCLLGTCNPHARRYAGAKGDDVRDKDFQRGTKEILGDLQLEKAAQQAAATTIQEDAKESGN